ncbi:MULTISPECIES: DUF5683 domain-containing protein [Hoylesella]|uniref:DUF5683 domain-containing protein n=2 Tax=Hoylesella TaxID=2974257 RepID=U2L4M6_9BACT|nr:MULTISPECIES: DUF5683 domain-containing protein [Hoylesella]ALO48013.1 hypothetical protein AS203_01965 [Hoylesella enoeca]ERJ99472.1 hypothetical protein HMPREF1218_1782 [Hoylesella pleuritidis F0068]
MDRHHHKILLLLLIVSILLVIAPRSVFAGELDTLQVTVNHDAKSIESESETPLDTLQKTVLQNTPKKKPVRDWATWHPNPKRALWLALVLPGAGQIYNRKYWKLPLVYGGFVGCVYAMRWNDQMYHDYSQAYLDISDDDPNTQSYNQFLHLGKAITKENMATYQNLFKQRKDRYRRWRDLSFFCLLGVYALSVIDAYVDASLSEFDISNNLSLRVEPAIINNRISRNPFTASAVGLQCSLNF